MAVLFSVVNPTDRPRCLASDYPDLIFVSTTYRAFDDRWKTSLSSWPGNRYRESAAPCHVRYACILNQNFPLPGKHHERCDAAGVGFPTISEIDTCDQNRTYGQSQPWLSPSTVGNSTQASGSMIACSYTESYKSNILKLHQAPSIVTELDSRPERKSYRCSWRNSMKGIQPYLVARLSRLASAEM